MPFSQDMINTVTQRLYYHPETGERAPEGMIFQPQADGTVKLVSLASLGGGTRTPDQIVKEEPVDTPIINTDDNPQDERGDPFVQPSGVVYSNLSLVIEARRKLGRMMGRRKTIVTGPLGLLSPAPLTYPVAVNQEQAQAAELELQNEGTE
tara:strand:+ start:3003 stop:3455 length:453 start_codon:yes stop_codon:yes gene_type:complete